MSGITKLADAGIRITILIASRRRGMILTIIVTSITKPSSNNDDDETDLGEVEVLVSVVQVSLMPVDEEAVSSFPYHQAMLRSYRTL